MKKVIFVLEDVKIYFHTDENAKCVVGNELQIIIFSWIKQSLLFISKESKKHKLTKKWRKNNCMKLLVSYTL